MIKKTRDTTALVKDLELQIDFLIGYTPQGNHWKQEWSFRQALLDETLASEHTPKEAIDKIAKIQETLYRLRNGEKHDQSYIQGSDEYYTITHPIIVREWVDNKLIEYTI